MELRLLIYFISIENLTVYLIHFWKPIITRGQGRDACQYFNKVRQFQKNNWILCLLKTGRLT